MALPPLPEGFVLDKAVQTQAQDIPPLPEGFTLDKKVPEEVVPEVDSYEAARKNLEGFEQRVAQGEALKDEDFLKPASEGGTKEFWDDRTRRYRTKLSGLTDVGGIVESVKEAGKGLIGQGQEAVDEINKKVYGDETQEGEGLTGLAKGLGSFATGAGVGGIVRAGQFMSNLAQDAYEAAISPEAEAKNELRRMKERAMAENFLGGVKSYTGSPKMFDVGAFAGEQALATKVPVLEKVAPRLVPQGALMASKLAEGTAGMGSKAVGYAAKGLGKGIGTPEGRAIATAAIVPMAGFSPWYALGEYVLDKSGGGAATGLLGSKGRAIKSAFNIIAKKGNTWAAPLDVSGEILTRKPVGMTYREFAREIAPQKIQQLSDEIADLESAVQGGSSEAFFKSQKAQAQKASWESASKRANKGDGWNDWFWNQTRDLISTGANVASNVGQAGLMTASAMPASDEDALQKGIGTAALIAGPMGLIGAKSFKGKVKSEEFAKVGKNIRGSNPDLDAISQGLEKSLSPQESLALEKLKGQIASAGGKTLDGSPIEVYVVPKEKYSELITQGGEPADRGQTNAVFDYDTGRVYINGDGQNVLGGIQHDGGHALIAAIEAIDKAFTDNLINQLSNDLAQNPKPWEQFKRNYEQQLGVRIDNEQLFSEWTAEIKRHIEEGRDLSTMEVPDSLKKIGNGAIYKALQWTGAIPPKNLSKTQFGTPQVSSAIKAYKQKLDTLRPKQLNPRTAPKSSGEPRTPAEDIQMANQAWSTIKDSISKIDEPGFGAIETAIGEVSKKFGSSEIGLPEEVIGSLDRQFNLPQVPKSAKSWWDGLGPMGKKQLSYEIAENHSTIGKRVQNWREFGDVQPQQASPDSPVAAVDPMASLVSKLRGNATPGKMANPALRSADSVEIFNAVRGLSEDVANKSVLEVLDESNKALADNKLWKSLSSAERLAFARSIKSNPDSAHNSVFGMGASDVGNPVSATGPDSGPVSKATPLETTPEVIPDQPTEVAESASPDKPVAEQASEAPGKAQDQVTETVAETPKTEPANMRVQEGEGKLANIEQFFTPSGMTKVTSERSFDKKTNTVKQRPVKKPYLIGRGFNRAHPEEMAVLNRAAQQSGNPESYTKRISEIENHINSGQYLDINYNSAENTSSATPTALERRAAQQAAEKGTGSRKLAQKFVIPETIRETQSGELTLQGYSIDKVLANNKKAVEGLNNAKQALADADPQIQEQLNRATEYLEGEDWKADLKAKNENNANGYRSDGKIFLEPVLDADGNITGARDANAVTRNPNYQPVPIEDWKIQALNLMEGGPSKTYFQESQVNIPGTGRVVNLPLESANPLLQTLDSLGDAFYVDRGGKKIAGVKNVIEPASETLRIDRIESIKPITKNLQVSPGSYKQRAAGFLPKGPNIAPPTKKAPSFASPALIPSPTRLYRPPSVTLRREEEKLLASR